MGLLGGVVDQLEVKCRPRPSMLVQDWGARRRLGALTKESRWVVAGAHCGWHREAVEFE